MNSNFRRAALAAILCFSFGSAPAQDSPDIAQAKAATLRLINLLVEQGVITRARAEALIAEINTPPAAPVPARPGAPAGASAPAPVRVPYVPEFVRKELKDEVRSELAAQALREGWAGPGAVPEWVRMLKVEGDVRTRWQFDNFDPGNAPAISITETNRNRALTLANTTVDRQRLRVRARLGATAQLDEQWASSIRLTTGNTTDPLSSNQTLGTYGNRFTVAFDRAFIRYRYADEFNAVAGRFGNPWFATELVWANDLGFDGIAAQWTPSLSSALRGFVTLGVMPIQELELVRGDKWLGGGQAGLDIGRAGGRRGKLGLAVYGFKGVAGQLNAAGSSLNDTTAPAFAQRGNTYFNISSDPSRPLLALASGYRLANVTGSLEIPAGTGRVVSLTGDWVRNFGYDRAFVSQRVGSDVEPEVTGFLVRAVLGTPDVARRGDWQAFVSYKRVERDAVPDAFTDNDLRLGGTDAKGYTVGAVYGLARNTGVVLRYSSGESVSGAPLAIDVLQLDLNVRF